MLRRLYHEQPEGFAFTPGNLEWAQAQLAKYPPGRQASAVIPLLWRAQEQEGWVTRPAIEEIARMLGMAYIRVLEVATFYFMFQLQPTGSVAHVQVCGTTSCMICGAEDLMAVCRQKIAHRVTQYPLVPAIANQILGRKRKRKVYKAIIEEGRARLYRNAEVGFVGGAEPVVHLARSHVCSHPPGQGRRCLGAA